MGTYEIIDDKTIVAKYNQNHFNFPGNGYQIIDGYEYEVTYTYDSENDKLYAVYSEELKKRELLIYN